MDLDDRCCQLRATMYHARSALHFYRQVAEKAKAINKKKLGHFFGTVQNMGLKSTSIEVCKIYEIVGSEHQKYSIPGICKYIVDLPIKSSRDSFIKDAYEIGVNLGKENSVGKISDSELLVILRDRLSSQFDLDLTRKTKYKRIKKFDWLRENLRKAKKVRNEVAHSCIPSGAISGLSCRGLEKLLDWSDVFLEFISRNILSPSVFFNAKDDAEITKNSILGLFIKLDVIDGPRCLK